MLPTSQSRPRMAAKRPSMMPVADPTAPSTSTESISNKLLSSKSATATSTSVKQQQQHQQSIESVVDAIVASNNAAAVAAPLKTRHWIGGNKPHLTITGGLQHPALIEFTHWRAGEGSSVTTRPLRLRNVGVKTLRVRLSQPENRAFQLHRAQEDAADTALSLHTLAESTQHLLGPGMTAAYRVSFSAAHAQQSTLAVSGVNIHIGEVGSSTATKVSVAVCASVPAVSVDMANGVDFGHVATGQTVVKSFPLRNQGEVETKFEWSLPVDNVTTLVQVTPQIGVLAPGGVCQIQMSICPKEVAVFQAEAVCKFTANPQQQSTQATLRTEQKTVPIRAVSQMPYVRIDGSTMMDFGGAPIPCRQTRRSQVTLTNVTAVPAVVTLSPVTTSSSSSNNNSYGPTTGGDAVFSVDFGDRERVLSPGMSITCTFTCSPAMAIAYCQEFTINVQSGNSVRIRCVATGAGPRVRLDTNILSFGKLTMGVTARKTILLHNESDLEAIYQFDGAAGGLLRVEPAGGRVAARGSAKLTIKIHPTQAINYRHRLHCLVLHAGVLTLDVIGSCAGSSGRPPELRECHLERYHQRRQLNLHVYSPDQLEDMCRRDVITIKDGVVAWSGKAPTPSATTTDLVRSGPVFASTTPQSEIVLSSKQINFGDVLRDSQDSSKTVTLTNNTKDTVSVCWVLGSSSSAVHMEPEQSDVEAGQTRTYTFRLIPSLVGSTDANDRPSFPFHVEWNAYVAFKSAMLASTARPDTIQAPWHVAVSCFGTVSTSSSATAATIAPVDTPTTSPTKQQKAPLYIVGRGEHSVRTINFGGCAAGQEIVTVQQVRNRSTTNAMLLDMDVPPSSDAAGKQLSQFAIFGVPMRLLQPGQTTLMAIGYRAASNDALTAHTAQLQYGPAGQEAQRRNVKLLAHVTQAQVEFVGLEDNYLALSPLCAGVKTSRELRLRNKTNLPVKFQWSFAQTDSALITRIQPNSGLLNGYQDQVFDLSVTPPDARDFKQFLTCTVTTCPPLTSEYVDLVSMPSTDMSLMVTALAVKPQLTASPAQVEMPECLIGQMVTVPLQLTNDGQCPLHYKLTLSVADCPSSHDWIKPAEDEQTMVIHAGTTKQALVCFQTVRIGAATVLISATVLDESDFVPSGHSLTVCTVNMVVHRAAVSLVDVWSAETTRESAWRRYSVANIQKRLQSAKSDCKPVSLQSIAKLSPDEMDCVLDFGAKAVGSSSSATFTFVNSGAVPAKWRISVIEDLAVLNADDYDIADGRDGIVKSVKEFHCSPETGHVGVGERETLTIEFLRRTADHHNARFQLLIYAGRPDDDSITVYGMLVGTSLPAGIPYLYVPAAAHHLRSLPIGMMEYPVQTVRLENPGDQELAYQIDTATITAMCAANMEFKVLELISPPDGIIAPGGSTDLELVARPISVSDYSVRMAIHFGGNGNVTEVAATEVLTLCWKGLPHPDMVVAHPTVPLIKVQRAATKDEHVFVPHGGAELVLSRDTVSCGVFPTRCISRPQTVTLKNMGTRTRRIAWSTPDCLDLVPSSAVLPADGSAHSFVVRLICTGDHSPRVFSSTMAHLTAVDDTDNADNEDDDPSAAAEQVQLNLTVTGMSVSESDWRLFEAVEDMRTFDRCPLSHEDLATMQG